MKCPDCGGEDSFVIDSRVSEGFVKRRARESDGYIRRRRQCACGFRFTTIEIAVRRGATYRVEPASNGFRILDAGSDVEANRHRAVGAALVGLVEQVVAWRTPAEPEPEPESELE